MLKKQAMKTLILVISIIILSASGIRSAEKGVASGYIFNPITIENGLPGNFIDDIYKDSKGFIWISMQGGGLSRYDGYEFMTLNVNSNPTMLKSNFVRKTIEDRFNRLWVISNGGVDIIDLTTMLHSGLAGAKELAEVTSNPYLSSIMTDSNGSIWILCTETVFKIDFKENGEILKVCKTDSSGSRYFTSINQIDNEIWAGNNGAICKIQEGNNNTLTWHNIEEIPIAGQPGMFIASTVKKDDDIWIATENALFRYNTASRLLKHYTHSDSDHRSITQNMVTDLALTDDNRLVVATLRGINIYVPSSDDFERISHDIDPNTLNNDFINCILTDNNGLWIGTEAGGINRMTKRALSIKNYTNQPADKNSISPNAVNSIYEDRKGNLWVGTVEGGLNMKEKNGDRFNHYTTERGFLTHNSVSCLEEDGDGNLWAGTWGGAINVINTSSLPAKTARHIINDGLIFVGVLKYDHINNGMWIGTNRDIFFYDIETQKLTHPLPNEITKNIAGTLGCLIDEKNQIWIGTTNGLIIIDITKFDKKSLTCSARLLKLNNEKLDKQFLKNVACIYQAKDSSIWIGSKGYGICMLKSTGSTIVHELYTDKNGIRNNTIMGIVQDDNGLIWASSGMGILSINPETKNIATYTTRDGLTSNQFYWNASHKSKSGGNMYFGSIGGLTELNGNIRQIPTSETGVVFTKLQIQNNTIHNSNNRYIAKDIAYTGNITMHERDRSFSIEFSGLDYDKPSAVTYSFRLKGFDDDWITNDASRRFASYTNLRPGTYTLQVRCKNQSSDWCSNISEIEIVVKPYFFRTTWFIAISIILLLILIKYLYDRKVNAIKRQRQVLHQKVEERTIELKNQKKQLEKQAVELKTQNNKLFAQNEEILEQRQQLLAMSEKVKEAMADRISFFTNITHEFRTPLTLIVGPIERALKLTTNPKVAEQLHFVEKNSKSLLALVNQLMDFRKVESESITIALTNENIVKTITDIVLPFHTFASERGITIDTLFRVKNPNIVTDKEAIRKLVTNLLSNAIKHSPKNGSISLYIGTIHNRAENNERLYIGVSDSGPGVSEDEIERIFERFYQAGKQTDQTQTGTGIGLYLCKSITKLMNGTITCKNNKTKGMTFRILLPISIDSNQQELPEDETCEYKQMHINDVEEDSIAQSGKKHENTILIVEDNSDMRSYIKSVLSDFYNTMEAENGKEALEILKSNHIDFIISDLMMPVMDGMELLKVVKNDINISHIPFLMLTAKASVESQVSSYRTGIEEYLTKPFNEELLLARVKNIIETRKRYQRKFSRNMVVEDLNISKESSDDKFIKNLMDTIKKNYKNPDYEIKDLADSMGISISLLNKKMVALTGQTPGNFIRNYRLNIAYDIIVKSSDDTYISEVAYETGFNDPKYFTRCFTKHFGITPSALAKDKRPRPEATY
jgi:signal transduction histidine kinase/ligand-binding sensor domain-containing protein/AraC-like DNA-binding protein